MYWLLLLGAVSVVTALIVTPLVRELSLRYGLVDQPDQERHFHAKAVPRTGGLAVAISYLAPFGLLLAIPSARAAAGLSNLHIDWRLPVAALLVLGIGLLDDIRGLNPWQKLLGLLIASSLACWGGVYIIGIHSYLFSPLVGVPITLLWLLLCANGFNLIDGIDGLATGVGILTTLAILLSAIFQHNLPLVIATVALAASLIGFLPYNFIPASIFLGDGGSLLVGFLLGCYAVLWGEKSTTLVGMTAPMIALAFPLLDTSVAIARRLLRGQPLFRGDRRHIHHRLLDRGLSPRRVVLLMYACCGAAGALSLVQSTNEKFAGLIVVVFCVSAGIGIHRLGYIEFGTFGRIFTDGTLSGALRANIQLSEVRAALNSAATPDDCWLILRRSSIAFGFTRAELMLGAKCYFDSASNLPTGENSWIIHIPLSQLGYIELAHHGESMKQAAAAGAFAETVGSALKAKQVLLQTHLSSSPPIPPRNVPAVSQIARAARRG
jgi:UDP-GlcNAc:undecaprenyl-phosphate GlcNAc-1-phosphate transferase